MQRFEWWIFFVLVYSLSNPVFPSNCIGKELPFDVSVGGEIVEVGGRVEHGFGATAGQPIHLWLLLPPGEALEASVISPSGSLLDATRRTVTSTLAFVATEAGDYRLRIDSKSRGLGRYIVRLSDLSLGAKLENQTRMDSWLAAGVTVRSYEVGLEYGQKVSVELNVDTAPGTNIRWTLYSPSLAILAEGVPNQSLLSIYPNEFGSHRLVATSDFQPETLIPFTIKVSRADIPMTARDGFGIVHEGTLTKGAKAQFYLSIPAPQWIYVDNLLSPYAPSIGLIITGPSGRTMLNTNMGFDCWLQLLEPGLHSVEVQANTDFETSILRFRILDPLQAESLPLNMVASGTLEGPFGAKLFRVHGSPGSLLLYDSSQPLLEVAIGTPPLTKRREPILDSNLIDPQPTSHPVLRSVGAQYFAYPFSSSQTLLPYSFALRDALRSVDVGRPVVPTVVQPEVGGNSLLARLRIEANDLVRIEPQQNLDSSPLVIQWLRADGSVANVSPSSSPSDWQPTFSGQFILFITRPLAPPPAVRIQVFPRPQPQSISLTQNVAVSVQPGVRKSVELAVLDGQRLYFDLITNNPNRLFFQSAVELQLSDSTGAIGSAIAILPERPFHIPLNGHATLTFATLGNFPADLVFRILDVTSPPSLPTNASVAASPGDTSARVFRYTTHFGSALRLSSAQLQNPALQIFDPGNVVVSPQALLGHPHMSLVEQENLVVVDSPEGITASRFNFSVAAAHGSSFRVVPPLIVSNVLGSELDTHDHVFSAQRGDLVDVGSTAFLVWTDWSLKAPSGRMEWVAPSTGPFALKETGDYTFHLAATTRETSPFGGRRPYLYWLHLPQSAAPLVFDVPLTLSPVQGTFQAYYQCRLPESGNLELRLSGTTGVQQTTFELFGSKGESISRVSGAPEIVSLYSKPGGTTFLKVAYTGTNQLQILPILLNPSPRAAYLGDWISGVLPPTPSVEHRYRLDGQRGQILLIESAPESRAAPAFIRSETWSSGLDTMMQIDFDGFQDLVLRGAWPPATRPYRFRVLELMTLPVLEGNLPATVILNNRFQAVWHRFHVKAGRELRVQAISPASALEVQSILRHASGWTGVLVSHEQELSSSPLYPPFEGDYWIVSYLSLGPATQLPSQVSWVIHDQEHPVLPYMGFRIPVQGDASPNGEQEFRFISRPSSLLWLQDTTPLPAQLSREVQQVSGQQLFPPVLLDSPSTNRCVIRNGHTTEAAHFDFEILDLHQAPGVELPASGAGATVPLGWSHCTNDHQAQPATLYVSGSDGETGPGAFKLLDWAGAPVSRIARQTRSLPGNALLSSALTSYSVRYGADYMAYAESSGGGLPGVTWLLVPDRKLTPVGFGASVSARVSPGGMVAFALPTNSTDRLQVELETADGPAVWAIRGRDGAPFDGGSERSVTDSLTATTIHGSPATLLIRNNLTETNQIRFQVTPLPPQQTLEFLTLNTLVTNRFDSQSRVHAYRFVGQVGQRLVIDGLSDPLLSTRVSFLYPPEFSTMRSTPTRQLLDDGQVLVLQQSGTFTVMLSNQAPFSVECEFRLLDLNDSQVTALGENFTNQLGGSAWSYRSFNARQGELYCLSTDLTSSGNHFQILEDNSFQTFTLSANRLFTSPYAGLITIRFETYPGGQQFAGSVRKVLVENSELSLGTLYEGLLAQYGDTHGYQFAAPPHTLLYFDTAVPDQPSVQVTIDSFRTNVLADFGPLQMSSSGESRLTITSHATRPVPYRFRLLNVSDAPDITLDAQTRHSLPPFETRFYRIQMPSRSRWYFEGHSTNPTGVWQLASGWPRPGASLRDDFTVESAVGRVGYLQASQTTSENSVFTFHVHTLTNQHLADFNLSPTVGTPPVSRVREESSLSFKWPAYDPEGDPIAFRFLGRVPRGMNISYDGTFQFHPDLLGHSRYEEITLDLTDNGLPFPLEVSTKVSFLVVARPTLLQPQLTQLGLALRWTSAPGESYQVQVKSRFEEEWSNQAAPVVTKDFLGSTLLQIPAGSSQLLFRLLSL